MTRDLSNDDEEIKINEEKLCDENNQDAIIFSTTRNDIRAITKSEINHLSTNISRIAVQKLLVRKNNNKDVKKVVFDKDKLADNIRRQSVKQ